MSINLTKLQASQRLPSAYQHDGYVPDVQTDPKMREWMKKAGAALDLVRRAEKEFAHYNPSLDRPTVVVWFDSFLAECRKILK